MLATLLGGGSFFTLLLLRCLRRFLFLFLGRLLSLGLLSSDRGTWLFNLCLFLLFLLFLGFGLLFRLLFRRLTGFGTTR